MRKKFIFPLILLFSCLTFSQEKPCSDCGLRSKSQKIELLKKDNSAVIDENFDRMNFLDPQLFDLYDSRTLAEMIVSRLKRKCDRGTKTKSPVEEDSEIIMLVPENIIGGIIKNGFKNQHQTGSTQGLDAKDARLSAEQRHVALAMPYHNKARELLPKYALQVFNDTKHGANDLPLMYGNVLFRFKPEIKKRSTWSMTDSLLLTDADSIPLRTNMEKDSVTCAGYCEAQIWGPLTQSDVDYVMIPAGSKVTDDMKALGVSIYTYSGGNSGKSELFKRSSQPVFKPQPGAKSAPLATTTSEIEKKFIEDQKNSNKSTQELIADFNSADKTACADNQLAKGSPCARLLAELTARPLKPETQGIFLSILKNGPKGIVDIAMSGLMKADFKILKPILLEQLSKAIDYTLPDPFMDVVVAAALNHKNDPEILAALQKSSNPFAIRMLKTPLCAKD